MITMGLAAFVSAQADSTGYFPGEPSCAVSNQAAISGVSRETIHKLTLMLHYSFLASPRPSQLPAAHLATSHASVARHRASSAAK
jgi:hypothetical protein